MKTTKKTAGKTAKTLNSLFESMFEESSKWEDCGIKKGFSEEEAKCITECRVKAYPSEYNEVFAKLYVSYVKDGKRFTIKDTDINGHKRAGVKLDDLSIDRLELEAYEEVDIDPMRVMIYNRRNIETDEIITRVRILKEF